MVKIAANAVKGFVSKPPPDIRVVLCYGPNSGLSREIMKSLALQVVPSLDDPFSVCEISAENLKSDPVILADEAAAISMSGGRRVILLRDVGDAAGDAVAGFLKDPVGDALILLTAGELTARSKLRKACEDSPAGAAIACYLDEAGGVDRLIDEGFRALSVTIDNEARHYLVDHLSSDRGICRSEIDKLALYAGQGGRLDLETVATLIGDSSISTMDEVIYAMLDGKAEALDRALDLAAEDGVAPVALLRVAGNQVLRLRRVQDFVASGTSLQSAVSGLRPPIFFKARPRFEASVKRWSPAATADALTLLLEAEAACKRSGAPDWTLCHRSLHQVAALGRRQGRRPR